MATLIHLDVGKYVVEIDDNLLSEDIFNDFGQNRLVCKVRSRNCRVYLAVKPFFLTSSLKKYVLMLHDRCASLQECQKEKTNCPLDDLDRRE